jgi:biopolymer transport protein ExbD
MSRHKKKHKGTEAVELNLAAMLDMAFQLLTFFILTFKPSPIEGQINLKLPPPQPVAGMQSGKKAGEDESNKDPVQNLNSLIITIFAAPNGRLASMAIGEANVAGVPQLDSRLKQVLGPESGASFDQVILQVGSKLKYAELMKVVDVCTKQTLANGEKLTKLSFVELPEGAAP